MALPAIWPEPSITGRVLAAAGDPKAVVSVGSWHSNVRISGVSFCVELDAPNAQGQTFVCPADRYTGTGQGTGLVPIWALNRFTFPRNKELRLELPLAKLVREGLIPSDRVRGWLAVGVIFTKGGWRRMGVPFNYVEDSKTVKIPFDLR